MQFFFSGTTRRWMCHGFLASKDSGERLSHAVGCAFTVCLERKQRRDTECSVTMTFDKQNSTFTRNGSFRQTTLTDRLHNNERAIDVCKKPLSDIVAPLPKPHNPYAIERPHATPTMLERQGSFRGLSNLNGGQSPFKRQMSLRLNDLPSNVDRQRLFCEPLTNGHSIRTVSPIPEVTPQPSQTQSTNPQPEIDVVSALCKELSQGLSMLTRNDNGDDLNFNLQTITTVPTTSTSDYVLPSTISSDAISKIAAISPIEATSPSAIVKPMTSSGYIPMDGPTVTPISYVTATRHRASVSGALPSTMSQHLHATADENKITTFGITKIAATAIVPPNNTQLPNADQWLGQIVKKASPAAKRAPPLHARAKSLTTDPFDAEWVASVTSKIDEVTKASEQPIITHTNPFISPIKQLDL